MRAADLFSNVHVCNILPVFYYQNSVVCCVVGSSKDILAAYAEIRNVQDVLEKEREQQSFTSIFSLIDTLASELGVQLEMPRTCSRQTLRENYKASNPAEYFKLSVVIPMYDNLIAQLETRFSTLSVRAVTALKLLPQHHSSGLSVSDYEMLHEAYDHHLPSPKTLNHEVSMYMNKISSLENKPSSAKEVLDSVPFALYPNLYTTFKILYTYPVTSATVERANSALGYVKNNRRATMSEERFNSLVLQFIHRDIQVDIQNVIHMFSSSQNRRLRFLTKE